MDPEVLNALRVHSAVLPGGRDKENRPVILIPVPLQLQPWTKQFLEAALIYILSILNDDSKRSGLVALVDAQRGSWRLARACIRQVTKVLGHHMACLIVLRSDAFWDKRRVENCAKAHRDGEPLYISRSRLFKYIDDIYLPEELGGSYSYNHSNWIQTRLHVEEFVQNAAVAITELDNLRIHLLDSKSVRANYVPLVLNINMEKSETTRLLVQKVVHDGKEILQKIQSTIRHKQTPTEVVLRTPQDTLDTICTIEKHLEAIEVKQILIEDAWMAMEKSFDNAREVAALEEGIADVTNWILGTAETLLNGQQRIGFDITSAEDLRREHEALELQCWETYGYYAEILYKVDLMHGTETPMNKDLISQRDFMDFICRSFATRLERRRNILITSLRFYRLVNEYFESTSEVYESLVMGNQIKDFEGAEEKLKHLRDSQQNLDVVARELFKEGEKLSDMLSMPVKDAVGRDVQVDYENDMINIRSVMDASTARRNIFKDNVELQELTLQQVTHIHTYEKDAAQAVQWLNDLFKVMVEQHKYVGCTSTEIQGQKDEHQTFQQTAENTYGYGCQLINAALALRQSCKLPVEDNTSLSQKLRECWHRLQAASQEQMTRLRVSGVFHRSVEDQCAKLQELRNSVISAGRLDDLAKRKGRLRKCFVSRETLMVEVGRMVRLGRMLKTRLKEPIDPEFIISDATSSNDNASATEAISAKLSEVKTFVEELDNVLRDVNQELSPNIPGPSSVKRIFDTSAASSTEDWNSSLKSSKTSTTEDFKSDEEFVTASECTCTPQSRSSSFHTASECGAASPWWEIDRRSDVEVLVDSPTTLFSELITSSKVSPETSSDGKQVTRSGTDTLTSSGKIIREVTETRLFKVSHCHVMGVATLTQTSESLQEHHSNAKSQNSSTERIEPETSKTQSNQSSEEEELLDKMQKVGDIGVAEMQPDYAWGKYYHCYLTNQAIKGCI